MNKLARQIHSFFSFVALPGRARARPIPLEPDTDLERYLFCRDSRSPGPPVR